jgi:hypothetical protein
MFHVGQKIMCVGNLPDWFHARPVRGQVYTVAAIDALNAIRLMELPGYTDENGKFRTTSWGQSSFRSMDVIKKTVTPRVVEEFYVYDPPAPEDEDSWHDSAVESFKFAIEKAIAVGA